MKSVEGRLAKLMEFNKNIKSNFEAISQTSNELLNLYKNVFKEGDQLNNNINMSLKNIEKILQLFKTTANGIERNIKLMNASSDNLMNSSNIFADHSGAFTKDIRDTVEKINELLNSIVNTASQYSKEYGMINNSLQGIFGDIQKGLKDYQTEVGVSLNKYLGEFTDKLTAAQGALGGNLASLQESVLELSDSVDKLIKKR